MFSFTLAARYLGRRKLRACLTILSVALAVMMVFGTQLLIPSLLRGFEANLLAATGQVDVAITRVAGETFPIKLVRTVQAIDGVRTAAGFLRLSVPYPANYLDPAVPSPFPILVYVTGLDPEVAPELYAYPLAQGRWLSKDDTGIILSHNLAQKRKLQVGDKFPLTTLQGTAKLVIVGIRAPRTVPGPEEVLLTLAQAQKLYNAENRINRLEANFNTTDPAQRAALQDALLAQLKRQRDNPSGQAYELNAMPPDTQVQSQIRSSDGMYAVMGVGALLMGGFIIFNTFRTAVAERRRDIGLLRAVGAARGTIILFILAESMLQGIIGTAIGLGTGYLMAKVMLLVTPALPGLDKVTEVVINPAMVLVVTGLGLGITLLASLLPALSASQVAPLRSLRRDASEASTNRYIIWSAILGVMCILLSAVGLWLGQVTLTNVGVALFLLGLALLTPAILQFIIRGLGQWLMRLAPRISYLALAQRNLIRQPVRAAVTASAAMLSATLIVALAGAVASLKTYAVEVIHKAQQVDYMLYLYAGQLGANPSLAAKLQTVSGVKKVATLRSAQGMFDDQRLMVYGMDPANFPLTAGLTFIEGDQTTACAELTQGRTLIANSQFLVKTGAQLGGTVNISTPSGTWTYRIVAIANDLFSTALPTAYTSQANLAADFNARQDMVLEVYLQPGADRTVIEPQLRAIAGRYPQFIFSTATDYFGLLQNMLEAVYAGMYGMLSALALPAAIALVNTLTISVLERTREIGMLRAIGTSRRQIHLMLTAEALVLMMTGTLFGLPGGLYLGYAMLPIFRAAGIPAAYTVPLNEMLYVALIGLAVGGLAALLPARQATRLEIVAALHYE